MNMLSIAINIMFDVAVWPKWNLPYLSHARVHCVYGKVLANIAEKMCTLSTVSVLNWFRFLYSHFSIRCIWNMGAVVKHHWRQWMKSMFLLASVLNVRCCCYFVHCTFSGFSVLSGNFIIEMMWETHSIWHPGWKEMNENKLYYWIDLPIVIGRLIHSF